MIFVPPQQRAAVLRVHIPREGERRYYMSRAKERTTNLALVLLTVFILTNLPYMVDELMRQDILGSSWCADTWCGGLRAIMGVSMVSSSCINPYIFLLFHFGLANTCLSRTRERFQSKTFN